MIIKSIIKFTNEKIKLKPYRIKLLLVRSDFSHILSYCIQEEKNHQVMENRNKIEGNTGNKTRTGKQNQKNLMIRSKNNQTVC